MSVGNWLTEHVKYTYLYMYIYNIIYIDISEKMHKFIIICLLHNRGYYCNCRLLLHVFYNYSYICFEYRKVYIDSIS